MLAQAGKGKTGCFGSMVYSGVVQTIEQRSGKGLVKREI